MGRVDHLSVDPSSILLKNTRAILPLPEVDEKQQVRLDISARLVPEFADDSFRLSYQVLVCCSSHRVFECDRRRWSRKCRSSGTHALSLERLTPRL